MALLHVCLINVANHVTPLPSLLSTNCWKDPGGTGALEHELLPPPNARLQDTRDVQRGQKTFPRANVHTGASRSRAPFPNMKLILFLDNALANV